MKTILQAIFLLLATLAHGQVIGPKPTTMYVYNSGKDTIHLTKIDFGKGFASNNFKIADSIQIDGIGAKELIFCRVGTVDVSDHGGSFDIKESKRFSKFEIWNLDSKQLLFEATSGWYYNYNIFRAGMPPRKGLEQYSYDFAIDQRGKITISNYKGTNAHPDHTVGTYAFINEKYIKLTDEPAKN